MSRALGSVIAALMALLRQDARRTLDCADAGQITPHTQNLNFDGPRQEPVSTAAL